MKIRKSLRDYTDDELIEILDLNESIELDRLGALSSEILRRLNDRKLLFQRK